MKLRHSEKRFNVHYAKLTVPSDVRHLIGKARFFKSTETGNDAKAALRIAVLVAGWKGEIAKARGALPDEKSTFWDSLRADHAQAEASGDEDAMLVIEEIAEQAATATTTKDAYEAGRLYLEATNQVTPLASLVTDWKASLRLSQKTIDQQSRDVTRMADHFGTLEALKPQRVKAWTDKLIKDAVTATSLERIMNGCRSFWRYVQDSGTLPVDSPDPFVGSFRLATKRAKRNTVSRVAFSADDLAKVYGQAVASGDTDLANLIALGAYTGARIEELCSLTVENSASGVFNIVDSKTAAGVREVPIHPMLVGLVATLAAASKDGYLIPSTAAGQYGVRSDPLSKRFGRLKESMNFGAGHVFHSIRKTVATLLEQAGVVEGVAADILGHEKRTLSYGLYSSGSSQAQKAAAIGTISYSAHLNMPSK
ncbi:hypothetical protein BH09PSE5_BH09PSE5_06790 [soil metagenome]